MKHAGHFLVAIFMALPGLAQAGVVFDFQETDLTGGGTQTNKMMIQDGNLRMSYDDPREDVTTVIFRSAEEEVLLINDREKTVRVMNKEMMQSMRGMMAGAGMAGRQGLPPGMAEKMEEAMKDMPPEKRAQAMAMMQQMQGMQGMQGPRAKPKPEIRETGQSDTVAGVSCTYYEAWEGGVKTEELCLADFDDVTGGEEAVAVLKKMASFFSQMAGRGDEGGFFDTMQMDVMEKGLPVLSRTFASGQPESETIITDTAEESLEPALFRVPDGYRTLSMMEQ